MGTLAAITGFDAPQPPGSAARGVRGRVRGRPRLVWRQREPAPILASL